jgi:hypothetical protein
MTIDATPFRDIQQALFLLAKATHCDADWISVKHKSTKVSRQFDGGYGRGPLSIMLAFAPNSC